MHSGQITDVPGILVGHAQDIEARTGVTIVLSEAGAIGGVDVRGGSPGTRETDLLRAENLVQEVHAVALCGGSAFGLDAAGGAMRYLEERGVGYQTAVARVPIVCAAVLFDLGVGDAKVRPDAAMGYLAASRAGRDVLQGSFGAGCGATCGKMLPGCEAARSGIGTASVLLPGGVVVGALIAVNALGDVIDPYTGKVLACGRLEGRPTSTTQALFAGETACGAPGENTTIGVVATNVKLDKGGCRRLAMSAHDGLALAIHPAHTPYDGDTLFALSTGIAVCEPALLHAAVVKAVACAVANAVLALPEGKI